MKKKYNIRIIESCAENINELKEKDPKAFKFVINKISFIATNPEDAGEEKFGVLEGVRGIEITACGASYRLLYISCKECKRKKRKGHWDCDFCEKEKLPENTIIIWLFMDRSFVYSKANQTMESAKILLEEESSQKEKQQKTKKK